RSTLPAPLVDPAVLVVAPAPLELVESEEPPQPAARAATEIDRSASAAARAVRRPGRREMSRRARGVIHNPLDGTGFQGWGRRRKVNRPASSARTPERNRSTALTSSTLPDQSAYSARWRGTPGSRGEPRPGRK